MKIGFLCYNLSGTGPRTRAKDLINGLADETEHNVVVLTNEPSNVSNNADKIKIGIQRPLSLIQSTKKEFKSVDVVHVPINIWQVAFVRSLYHGSLVAGVGPGIQTETWARYLGRVLRIDRKIETQANSGWEKSGYETAVCTATIDRKLFHKYDQSKIKKIREEMELNENNDIVLYVGKLSEVYGANIISDMADIDQNRTYLVIGDGPLRDQFENHEHVNYLGYIPNDELPKYYNIADVTVGPRNMDGTSNVGLESIACGTPYITTAVGKIIEEFAVEPGAYLQTKHKPDSIIKYIDELIDNNKKYHQQVKQGLEFIEDNPLTRESAIETHLKVYEELSS
jgi:glycosyltransferase involved in cell wall biosynthesis